MQSILAENEHQYYNIPDINMTQQLYWSLMGEPWRIYEELIKTF